MSLTIRAALAAALGATLVPISASALSGSALVQRLDSIAGAFVRANRTVGLVECASDVAQRSTPLGRVPAFVALQSSLH